MLYAVRCVRVFVHHANAPTRQRNNESSVAEPIKLTTERQAPIGYESESINRLPEANSVIEMLS